MSYLKKSLTKVFADPLYLFLGGSLAINLLVLDYFIFRQTTTLEVFFSSNSSFYNWAVIFLTLVNALFFGLAVSLIILSWREKKALSWAGEGASSFLGGFLGAISSGCPVCGAWLLPILGVAGSLAAFPLQGLEIKFFSLLLLSYSINEASKNIAGLCSPFRQKLFSNEKDYFILKLNRQTLPQLKPAFLFAFFLLLLYLLPKLPPQYKISFARRNFLTTNLSQSENLNRVNTQALFTQVNPPKGYTINVKYGDLGPKLLRSGAIDLEKFKSVYERAGTPLTKEQLTILTEGLEKKITINQDNAYFLINFFWALGLANKNPLLEQGAITKYGKNQIASFASTGGWTLGSKKVMDIYSQSRIIPLTGQQQAKVEEVANNSYRPCCGNPTAFPDCNHGMALLGVLELLAANNASLGKMYEAAKYFNAFWFPQNYLDIATYFKAKEGKDFKDIDPKIIVSAQYSSGKGWSQTKRWLADNNLIEKAPKRGGGCGV